jgi:hypothetical protein
MLILSFLVPAAATEQTTVQQRLQFWVLKRIQVEVVSERHMWQTPHGMSSATYGCGCKFVFFCVL